MLNMSKASEKLDNYKKALLEKGILSVPMVTSFNNRNKPIPHQCSCGVTFQRAPKNMLSVDSTGVCDSCHRIKKRKKKVIDDNGYLNFCKTNNYSLPVNPELYVNAHTKLDHQCKSCNSIYSKSPNKAKRDGYLGVCEECTKKLVVAKRKIEGPESVKFLKELGASSTILVGDFKGMTFLNTFKCGSCTEVFEKKPTKFKSPFLCEKCLRTKAAQAQALTIAEIIEKVKESGLTCTLISTEVKNNRDRLEWHCQCGNAFKRPYPTLLKENGSGLCTPCGKKLKAEQATRTAEEYDLLLSKARSGITRLGPYINSQKPTQHQCSCGNKEWYPKPNNILHSDDNCGCLKGFKSEALVRNIFEQLFQKPFPSSKPDFLKIGPRNRLQLDGYCVDLNLAFEYHGIQHYEHCEHFHKTENEFKHQQELDFKKLELCQNLGVTLIVIPYFELRLATLRKDSDELLKFITQIYNQCVEKGVQPLLSPEAVTVDWSVVDVKKK